MKIFTLLSLVLLLMSSTCQKPTGFYLVDNKTDKNLYSEKIIYTFIDHLVFMVLLIL